ncbi:signal recognition particle protein [Ureaplasma miroungigenitalium]|uniref:signal-recognition-particle GTPase n=1 Tax=Ureaplasma miroungigenitalium TaxID=1042321 RepID=A0ABT3BN72_9BACT|nr:signal recognition particle protein [Ureaplasma miroungigenitalium]MCV3728679.1 signal recognition particle protein [Ureaplasma miroungigenitalium]MCV3734370.1 signal recognition particle protein [Ureaplasma miroungigenitalium]
MLNSMISSLVAKRMAKKLKKETIQPEDLKEVLSEIRIALLDADVNLAVVKKFINDIKEAAVGVYIEKNQSPADIVLKIIKDELVKILGVEHKPVNTAKSQLKIMMVGLQGSGKTTTCGKLANYFRNKFKKRPMLVAADIYRPAAIDQLETLASQTRVNFFADRDNQKVDNIVKQAMHVAEKNDDNLIIVDTAGRLQTNDELMQELVDVKRAFMPDEVLLVVDAMAGQDIINVAREFHNRLNLTGIVVTKLDSDARAGAVLSLTSLLNVPIKFTGTGEKLGSIDDFHPTRMADRILGLGDIMTLAEKAMDVVDEKKARASYSRMVAGKMDFEDLKMQFEQMSKIGSLGAIKKMIPGMSKISDDDTETASQKIKVWSYLLDSMTLKERRNPKLFKKEPTRRIRVLKGSGRTPDEFNKLYKQWENAREKMAEIGKMLKSGKNPFGKDGIGDLF